MEITQFISTNVALFRSKRLLGTRALKKENSNSYFCAKYKAFFETKNKSWVIESVTLSPLGKAFEDLYLTVI